VKPGTLEKMLSILQKEYDSLYQNGGKPPKLTDAVSMPLWHWQKIAE
jgi:hypothetical protein